LVRIFGGYDGVTHKIVNEAHGYLITTIIFSVISLIAFGLTFLSTKERVAPPKGQKSSLKEDVKDLMKNKPWIILFFVSMLNLIYVGAWSTSFEYYFKYFFKASFSLNLGFIVFNTMDLWNTFGAVIIALILIFPTANWLSNSFGKRNTLIVCFGLVAFSICGLYFCGPYSLKLLFIFQFIQSAAAAVTMPIVWSMYADAADYSEWKNKRRATGLIFSAVVLGQKSGIAIGSAITMWVLGLLGYDAVLAKTNPELLIQKAPQLLYGIRYAISFVPGILAFITMAVCFFYPLSNKNMDQIQAELSDRRTMNNPS
jgi:GPH family glycoside/pentoside/hexuronide:cation symporter